MKLKYLFMDNMSRFGNTEGFSIFPEFENHDRMARKLGGKEHVISAGFVSMGEDESGGTTARCYGESQLLGIKSREDFDSDMITRAMRGY